jgi:hypothetical protein
MMVIAMNIFDAGSQKAKCTVLDVSSAGLLFCPASTLKLPYVENAFKKLNHWIQPLTIKSYVPNVVTEE